jgi:hypothetical protein
MRCRHGSGKKNGRGWGPDAYRKKIIQSSLLLSAFYPPKTWVFYVKEIYRFKNQHSPILPAWIRTGTKIKMPDCQPGIEELLVVIGRKAT